MTVSDTMDPNQYDTLIADIGGTHVLRVLDQNVGDGRATIVGYEGRTLIYRVRDGTECRTSIDAPHLRDAIEKTQRQKAASY